MTTARPVTSHPVELADGVRLKVETRGAGPAVVLLHGFTGDASTMDVLATRLELDRTVVAPNLIGHGGSTGPAPHNYTVDAMASQVFDALDQLGFVDPVDVVGYSMGGRVALTMACHRPNRVKVLSVIGASAGLATAGERSARIEADELLARSIEADGLAAFVDRWMADPLFASQDRLGDAWLAASRAQRMRNDPAELARSLRGAGTGSMRALHEEISACSVPTRFLVGADDEKFTAIANDLSERMPNARVAVVAAAGHAAHLERPDEVCAELLARSLAEPVRSAGRAGPVGGAQSPGPASLPVVASLFPVELPLITTLSTARTTIGSRSSILLRLSTGEVQGWGEASPLAGWSAETIDECRRALVHVAARLSGRRVDRSLDMSSETDQIADDEIRELLRSLEAVPAARAAVVGALLDIEARRDGVVLHDLLARKFGSSGNLGSRPEAPQSRRSSPPSNTIAVEVNALVADTDRGAVGRAVARCVAAGFTTVKLKMGAVEPASDIARVAAARAAGPGLTIRLDANGAWDMATALSVLEAVEGFDVAFCEEPVAGMERIAEIGRRSSVAVAIDESARTAADLARLWALASDGTIAAVVVKPQALGGADLALAAIERAQEVGMSAIVTTMVDSAVGVAHAAHVAAAAGLPLAHGLSTSRLLARDVADVGSALPIVAGCMRFAADTDPTTWGSGLGIGAVSPDALRPS